MMRMPDEMKKLYDEWVAKQLSTAEPVEKPQELQDYLEKRKHAIEKAEANGCMIG